MNFVRIFNGAEDEFRGNIPSDKRGSLSLYITKEDEDEIISELEADENNSVCFIIQRDEYILAVIKEMTASNDTITIDLADISRSLSAGNTENRLIYHRQDVIKIPYSDTNDTKIDFRIIK